MNTLMAWLVVMLILIICISLGLALKYLIFKSPDLAEKLGIFTTEKKVVSFLTLRIIFSAILLIFCYFYLSSLNG
ncbi:MAG: hypothetical protein ACI9B7_000840 [Oleispira sp.]|jgi:hypothetical protein